jgi:hypothetical protein
VEMVSTRAAGNKASNRVLALGGCEDVSVGRVKIKAEWSGGIFIENHCRRVSIESIDATFGGNDWWGDMPVLFVCGADRVTVGRMRIVSESLIIPWSSGGAAEQVPPLINRMEVRTVPDWGRQMVETWEHKGWSVWGTAVWLP